MCLTKEWFMQSEQREAMRNENGVKLEHAIEDLRMIHTTLSPYAWEMAEWIYRNWTLEQFLQLPVPERDIVMKYVENHFSYPGVKAARQKRRLERKESPTLPAQPSDIQTVPPGTMQPPKFLRYGRTYTQPRPTTPPPPYPEDKNDIPDFIRRQREADKN